MTGIYVIKSRSTKMFYYYVGHGCHKWVINEDDATHFEFEEAAEQRLDLACLGYEIDDLLGLPSKAVQDGR